MLSDLPPSPPIRLFRPRVRPGKTAAESAQIGREVSAAFPEGARNDATPPPPVAVAAEAERDSPEPLETPAMTQTIDQQPPAGPTDAEVASYPAELRHALMSHWRQAANFLCLFYFCNQARCRRALRCRGNPNACLRERAPLVPHEARQWVAGLMQARERGLDFDEACEEVAEFEEAYTCWRAGLNARAGV